MAIVNIVNRTVSFENELVPLNGRIDRSLLTFYSLAYLTLPSGIGTSCPALRPYPFSPMRIPDVTKDQ